MRVIKYNKVKRVIFLPELVLSEHHCSTIGGNDRQLLANATDRIAWSHHDGLVVVIQGIGIITSTSKKVIAFSESIDDSRSLPESLVPCFFQCFRQSCILFPRIIFLSTLFIQGLRFTKYHYLWGCNRGKLFNLKEWKMSLGLKHERHSIFICLQFLELFEFLRLQKGGNSAYVRRDKV